MKIVRKLILSIFGLKGYLQLISKVYISMVSGGMLKKKYPELFYLETLLKEGYTCIDIGANLGYYSTKMSKLVGKTGAVHAVEPVPLFYSIWKKNTKGLSNTTLYPYALGENEGAVKMGMPEKDGILHHGMTKVASSSDEQYVEFFDVEMKNPDILFSNIDKIDFIKCDVEGYEFHVFSNFKNTLSKHRPTVQSELGGEENRKNVIDLFSSLNYKTMLLKNGKLESASEEDRLTANQDFYFIPN